MENKLISAHRHQDTDWHLAVLFFFVFTTDILQVIG
jgi:hypothetical protein